MGISQRAQIEAITDMDQVMLQWELIHGLYPTQKDIYVLNRELMPLLAADIDEFGLPIAGSLDATKNLRDMKMQIGTTSSYTVDMQRILAAEAARLGFEPDVSVCSDQVPSGRPHPWMCFKAALELQQYPMEAIVKVGDTLPDVEDGLNAGMWTIAIAGTGNEVGMNESELMLLSEKDKNARIIRGREKLSRGGAHYVADSLEDVPQIVEDINRRMADGDHP